MSRRDTGSRSAGRVTIRVIDRHTDLRGEVFEPLEPNALSGQRNAHVVLTEPGHVRGNHVHRNATEVLVVRGPALVRFVEDGQVRDVHVGALEVLSFTFPPGVAHAVRNTGTTPSVLVAFRDVEHDPGAPDTVRVLLLN